MARGARHTREGPLGEQGTWETDSRHADQGKQTGKGPEEGELGRSWGLETPLHTYKDWVFFKRPHTTECVILCFQVTRAHA